MKETNTFAEDDYYSDLAEKDHENKMKKEFNLSEKMIKDVVSGYFCKGDVKEFIRLIEETKENGMILWSTIEHYAGDKLK